MRPAKAIVFLLVAGIAASGSNEPRPSVLHVNSQRVVAADADLSAVASVRLTPADPAERSHPVAPPPHPVAPPPHPAESTSHPAERPSNPAERPPHPAESMSNSFDWQPYPAEPEGIASGEAIFGPFQNSSPVLDNHGYRFVRVRYDDNVVRRRRGAWATDYPTAERNLHEAIERTTGLYVDGPPIVLELTDERIFEHPFLYLTEPGYWRTNDEEVAMLRKYLDRGGFLLIDDFHDYGRGRVGPQWNNMYENMKRVFPDREPIELTAEHPIWSVYYDIDPDAAMSTKNSEGWGPRFGPLDDVYYGIFDDDGRMVVAICYNQDIGDGWEWPNRNLADASTVSFQMGINMIIFALTH